MTEPPRFDRRTEARMRAEAHGMARAYVHALRAELPRDAIVGVWGKGSAYRPWDSVLDYVPEISDVDIHARVVPEAAAHLSALGPALNLAYRAQAKFDALFPEPIHRPRPQLVFLHEIEEGAGYVGSPEGSMHTLFGEAPTEIAPEHFPDTRAVDADRFRADDAFVSKELAGKVHDRPGPIAWRVVWRLTWRVAPVAPRVLTQLGMASFQAWSINRTRLVRALHEADRPELAEAYTSFYMAGWDGYRSRYEDGEAAQAALRAVGALYDEARPLFGASPALVVGESPLEDGE